MMQSRKIIWLVTFVVFVALVEGNARSAEASAQDQDQGQGSGQQQHESFSVGHATRILNVPGIYGEPRPVNVHLWYPSLSSDDCNFGKSEAESRSSDADSGNSDVNGDDKGCPSVYTSRLHGIPLLQQWDPLSWTIGSTISFENLPISGARSFPVIIFSHGNQNNAIDYVYTLEALASHGFIVAAPDHLNNTQDDVRIDFINAQAGSTVIPCFDGLPSPCTHTDLKESMTDRVRDVSAIIDALPTWFGSRADTLRVGVMGHSRGSVTALAAAGGSTIWGFSPDSRVKAIMGLSIGNQNVTAGVDLPNVRVPTLLLAGLLDQVGPLSVSQFALSNISGGDKTLVKIANAKHRHFDSGLCAITQSSGVIAEANPLRAILDRQTVSNALIPPNPSGVPMDYCGPDTFFDTVNNPPTYDIRPLVASLTGFIVTSTNVPTVPPGATTGLTSEQVKEQVIQLAVAFFGRVL